MKKQERKDFVSISNSPLQNIFITFPWLNAPTTAGTKKPGMVAAMLVIPINTPEMSNRLIRE